MRLVTVVTQWLVLTGSELFSFVWPGLRETQRERRSQLLVFRHTHTSVHLICFSILYLQICFRDKMLLPLSKANSCPQTLWFSTHLGAVWGTFGAQRLSESPSWTHFLDTCFWHTFMLLNYTLDFDVWKDDGQNKNASRDWCNFPPTPGITLQDNSTNISKFVQI